MQITIYTMKYRNKNYIGIGMLPLIILPVITITIGLTLWISEANQDKTADFYPFPKTNLIASHDDLLADTPEFKSGDEALFNFTGDTVLVVTQPESLAELEEEVRVLHKTKQGSLETVDLPENWLVKLQTDTVPAEKPVPPVKDKKWYYDHIDDK
jgi:hypothetical protein